MPSLLEHVLAGSHHLPFQREILQSSADYTILHGGVGVGKTRTCLWYIFKRCLFRPGQTILVGAKTYKQIEDVVLGPWEDEIPADLWKSRGDDIIVPCLTGGKSVIKCRSLDKKYKWSTTIGTTLTGYYLAQAEQLPEELYHKLHSRMRDQKNRHLWFRLYDCNADSKQHWLYRFLIDENSPEYVGLDGATVKAVHVKYSDNPNAYSAIDIATAKRQKGEAGFRLEYEGEWGAIEGKLFSLRENEQIREDIPSGSGKWYLAMDHGFHFSALLCFKSGPYSFVARETLLQNPHAKPQLAAVKDMIAQAQNEYGHFEITGLIGDPAGTYPSQTEDTTIRPRHNATQWMCSQLGLKRLPTFNFRKEGWNKLDEMFRDFEADRNLLTVHPRCVELIRSLEAAEWNDDVTDTVDFYDHPADALRYFIMSRER